MALPVWVNNLIAYCLQIAILAASGTLLAYIFRLRMPRVALAYWQLLLLVCVLVFAFQEWRHPVYSVAPAETVPIEISLPGTAVPAMPSSSFPIGAEWIGWTLAAGMVARLLWLVLGLLRLRFYRDNAHTLGEEPSSIREMRLLIQVQASVLYSEKSDSPVTFGIRRPVIILPSGFHAMDENCQKAVLCHELLHIRRRDWLFVIVEEIFRAIFWFHPAIWWLLGRIRLSREQVVDCDVVRLAGNREPYLESLLEFARAQGRPGPLPAPLFLTERHLVQRVALLLKEVSMSRSRLFVSLTGITILLTGTVRLASGWFPLTGAPVPGDTQAARVAPSALPSPGAIETSGPMKIVQLSAPQLKPAPKKIKQVEVAENRPNLPAEVPAVPVAETAQIQASGREPIRVGGNIQESKLIYKVEPVYPEQAKNARITGNVTMTVTANEQGFVSDIRVNSGHPLLVDAAVAAVKQWRYSPTLLNGAPVPVMFTVTCFFNYMGENDVSLAMDESGNLSASGQVSDIETLMPKLLQGGTAYLRIAPGTPIQVAERTVQGLLGRGVQQIRLSGPFARYQGKLFYTGPPATPPRVMPNIEKLRTLLDASAKQTETGVIGMLFYSIYINEAGEILGVQRMAGPDNPEIDRELMRASVLSPAFLGSDPVPFVYTFRIGM